MRRRPYYTANMCSTGHPHSTPFTAMPVSRRCNSSSNTSSSRATHRSSSSSSNRDCKTDIVTSPFGNPGWLTKGGSQNGIFWDFILLTVKVKTNVKTKVKTRSKSRQTWPPWPPSRRRGTFRGLISTLKSEIPNTKAATRPQKDKNAQIFSEQNPPLASTKKERTRSNKVAMGPNVQIRVSTNQYQASAVILSQIYERRRC
jgi:hypothetical protein